MVVVFLADLQVAKRRRILSEGKQVRMKMPAQNRISLPSNDEHLERLLKLTFKGVFYLRSKMVLYSAHFERMLESGITKLT
jgi:hypothetical protein